MNTNRNSKLEGRYFPAGGSASFPALLEVDGDAVCITDTVSGDTVHPVFVELGDRLANVPRKIYFHDGSVFESADNNQVDELFGKTGHFFTRLSSFEMSYKFVAVAVVATILLLATFYRYGLPAAAQLAAWATPSSAVQLIDKGALDAVDRAFFNPSKMAEADKARYLELFDELKAVSVLQPDSVRLLFRDGGKLGANAVALPGGTVILTDQLAKLSKNDDEIAGVLAHEIGHVEGRHSLRQIYRALGIAFVAAIVIGDTSQLLDNVIAQVALLDTLSYSRKFETESDATSVRMMHKLGRDPVAFIDLIDRVFKEAGVEGDDAGWFSTHPGNKSRREDVLKELERM